MRRIVARALTCWLISLPAQAGDLDALSFMTGHWVAAGDDNYEEVWLAPAAGTLPGSFRWVFPNGRQVLEYLVIEETDEGVFFRFKHFNPNYEAWEKEPNTYRLTAVDESSATFERVSDNMDVPKTLSYTREGNTLSFVGTGDSEREEPLELNFRLRD
ncbi:MAG: hypothetical protein HUJ31_12730 [Pseudomonadales bacterium]|nr:hypothetical protein [Pseudomonadales bacterium]